MTTTGTLRAERKRAVDRPAREPPITTTEVWMGSAMVV
jgi:hypothetical protein